MAALPCPSELDVASLENWIYNNKPLIREESEFIQHRGDLFALAPPRALGLFDVWVHRFVRFRSFGRRVETVRSSLAVEAQSCLS